MHLLHFNFQNQQKSFPKYTFVSTSWILLTMQLSDSSFWICIFFDALYIVCGIYISIHALNFLWCKWIITSGIMSEVAPANVCQHMSYAMSTKTFPTITLTEEIESVLFRSIHHSPFCAFLGNNIALKRINGWRRRILE